MSTEYEISSYYNKDNKVNKLKYVDTHRSVQLGIEGWLKALLFKNDSSRVVYASPDIAFRKRIESLDNGKNADGILKPESLELPFATYFKTGDPEPDDRMAAVNAAQAVKGIYYPELDRTMRALAVKTTYKATCFFARQDDVREAQQLLLWEQKPEYPIQLYHTIEWRNASMKLPVFITIENITTNPEYQQTDWLSKHKIFMVECELTVRSYQFLINNVNKVIQLPIRFRNFEDLWEEDEEHEEILTEHIILDWVAEKYDIDIDPTKVDTNDSEYKEVNKFFTQVGLTPEEERMKASLLPNRFVTDVLEDYFEDNCSAGLNKYLLNEEKTTSDTVVLDLDFSFTKKEDFTKAIFEIATKPSVEITDPDTKELLYPGLKPNSEYKINIRIYDKKDNVKYYHIKVKTKDSPDNKAPKPEKINFAAGLVGMRFS